MRTSLTLFVSSLGCLTLVVPTENNKRQDRPQPTPDEHGPPGSLLFAGGALRYDNAQAWDRFVHLAGGKGPVVVIPAAAGNPTRAGQSVVEHLVRRGVAAETVPISPRLQGVDPAAAVRDEAIVRKLRRAKGIWFVGGEQRRITQALRPGGAETPALRAIWEAYRHGAVIGGTSAGTAVMSEWMFADAMDPLDHLKFGIVKGKHVDRGLGFLGEGWFVDQHFLARGRFARALVAMREYKLKYGIGVDEDTAVQYRDGKFEVIGYNGALFLDLSQAETDTTLPAFNLKRARLSYLAAGDRLDAQARTITVSAAKRSGQKIDPRDDKTFRPTVRRPNEFYFSDVLGSNAIYRAMVNVLDGQTADGKTPRVKGLAFAQPEGGTKNDLGFEFTIYRGDDTIGWYSSAGGYESYSIHNVYVDVVPVKLARPLYEPLGK